MTLDDRTRNTKNENVDKSKDSHKNPKKINPRINTTVTAVSYTHLTLPTICSV